MISIRINQLLNGYNRTKSNTPQFLADVGEVDKLLMRIFENKNYIKIRNKFLDCLELFQYETLNAYIIQYHKPFFRHDVLALWEDVSSEIKLIKGIK